MNKVIFFGNGPLAEYALAVIESECQVIFHARSREDLDEATRLKREQPEAYGVLASFGAFVPESILEVFGSEGILNIHPSLLPLYRGASPIESAILAGDSNFSVSVMKLAKAMDAGPIYWQGTFSGVKIAEKTDTELVSGLVPPKEAIYQVLAEAGAEWICRNLDDLPEPSPQDESKATFCGKFTKKDGLIDPSTETAEKILRKIVAFQGFPKTKCTFYGVSCAILEAHMLKQGETAVLTIEGSDGRFVAIDELQPDGRKAMDAKAFLNGYKK